MEHEYVCTCLTEQEALAEIARLRSLLDAQQPVVDAAIANAKAVVDWRRATYSTPAPSQREQSGIMNRIDETRARLLETVDAYRTARTKAKVADSIARVANNATLQASSRA